MVPLPKILASRLVEFFFWSFCPFQFFIVPIYGAIAKNISESTCGVFFSGVFALSNFLSCLYMVPLPKILASRLVAFFFWSFCPFQFFIVPIYGAIAKNISESTCGVFFLEFLPFPIFYRAYIWCHCQKY